MKRLHVHVAVERLAHSIGFYRTLFAAEPTVVKSDYAIRIAASAPCCAPEAGRADAGL